MADDETARLTAALVALEREHHALKVRYRHVCEQRDQARRTAAAWRRVAEWIWAATSRTEET